VPLLLIVAVALAELAPGWHATRAWTIRTEDTV